MGSYSLIFRIFGLVFLVASCTQKVPEHGADGIEYLITISPDSSKNKEIIDIMFITSLESKEVDSFLLKVYESILIDKQLTQFEITRTNVQPVDSSVLEIFSATSFGEFYSYSHDKLGIFYSVKSDTGPFEIIRTIQNDTIKQLLVKAKAFYNGLGGLPKYDVPPPPSYRAKNRLKSYLANLSRGFAF